MTGRPNSIICPIHGGQVSGNNIVRDHNHRTGKFRGWLCRQCNSRLGWMEKRLDAISDYLRGDTLPDNMKRFVIAGCLYCGSVRVPKRNVSPLHEIWCPIRELWMEFAGRRSNKTITLLRKTFADSYQRERGQDE